MPERLWVALDVETLKEADGLLERLAGAGPPETMGAKIGSQLFTAAGPANVEAQVLRLAERAREAGLDGCVTSPQEIRLLRRALGPRWVIVTPGIRPAERVDDQKRVATPADAIRAGADAIVVGRPITAVPDPRAAAAAILSEIAAAAV